MNKPLVSKSRQFGFVAGIALLPIFFLFAICGHPETGLYVVSLIGVFAMTAFVKRNLIKNIYFITILSIIFALQLLFVATLKIPSEHLPGYVVMPFAVGDLCFLLVVAYIFERWAKPAVEKPPAD